MTIQRERRLSERKTLGQLSYIQLPFDNGGIVLNVSEGGLSFRAVDSMEGGKPIPFWFSAIFFSANSKRIEGIGELAWTDETLKTGGLRFTQLSADVREEIRSWPIESHRLHDRNDSEVREERAPELPVIAARNGPSSSMKSETRIDSEHNSVAFARPDVLPPGTHAQVLRPPEKSWFEEESRGPFKAIGVTVLAIIIAMLVSVYFREAAAGLHWLSGAFSEKRPHLVAPTTALVGNAAAEKAKTDSTPTQTLPPSSGTTTPQTAQVSSPRPAPEALAADTAQRKPGLLSGGLVVQVGAFEHEDSARKLAESLRKKNFPAFLSSASGDRALYYVQVGSYADEESARIAQIELERAGFKSFIRH